MPLLGKVPWSLDPRLDHVSPTTEYWVVRFTDEIFTKYEDYLKRIELYRERIWTCKITEKSGLTYEEAALSEKRSSAKADYFPDFYLEPFLNIVHLNTSTLLELVDEVHTQFKENYVVGEYVECTDSESKWQVGRIVEALSKYSSSQNGNGRHSASEASYKLALGDDEEEIVTRPKSALRRKKFLLTKDMIKQKIRQIASRDRYSSSPWLVDYELAERYSLAAYDGGGTEKEKGDEEEIDGEERPSKRAKTYPMEDLDLDHEDTAKIPPPTTAFTVPIECVGDLFTVWHFVVSFGKGLQLSPFSMEDLENALIYAGELDLIDELHIFTFNQRKGGALPKKAIHKESWPKVLQTYLEKFIGEKHAKDEDMSDTSSHTSHASHATEDSSDGEKEDKDEDNENGANDNSDADATKKAAFRVALEEMRKNSWYDLKVTQKVLILKQLCEAALQTDTIRTQIDNYIEETKELTKEMKEQDLVDKKRQKEIEKTKTAKTTTKAKTGAKSKAKANDKEKEKEADKGNEVREAQKQARREEALDKHNIRLISIGQDRFHNRYWYWNALYGRLFVERPTFTNPSSNPSTPPTSPPLTTSNSTTPSVEWGYYSTKSELDALLEFLDERGIREQALRAALTKKYPKMIAGMDKRVHDIISITTEVRRSSRIKTVRTDKDPPYMTYVNKYGQ